MESRGGSPLKNRLWLLQWQYDKLYRPAIECSGTQILHNSRRAQRCPIHGWKAPTIDPDQRP